MTPFVLVQFPAYSLLLCTVCMDMVLVLGLALGLDGSSYLFVFAPVPVADDLIHCCLLMMIAPEPNGEGKVVLVLMCACLLVCGFASVNLESRTVNISSTSQKELCILM